MLYWKCFSAANTARLETEAIKAFITWKDFQQLAEDYPHLKGLDLVEQFMNDLNVRCELGEGDLENIPSQGPVLFVANHPIGSLDGLAILRAVATVRPDVKIVANQMLSYLEPLQNLFIPVDNVGNRTNRQQVVGMQSHLDNQGALVVFLLGKCLDGELKAFAIAIGVRDFYV